MVGKSTIPALALLVISAATAHAQYPGGLLGSIINNIQQQQQAQQRAEQQQQLLQQQQLQRQMQQQQQQQQQQEQQQAQDARQRAQADARARADADAKARQRQADIELKRQQTEAAAKAAAEERRTQEALKKLRADPVLVAVIGADKRDITALIAGQDTPNVVRNLQGDPAFQQNPTLCMPFGGIVSDPNTPEWRFLSSVQTAIEQKGGAPVVMTACDPAEIDHYDLVVFSADQVANGPLSVLSAVVDVLRQRQFVPFATFTMASFEAGERAKVTAAREAEARQTAARDAARAAFQVRDSTLYSTIYAAAPAAVVCLLSTSDTVGLRYLLMRKDSPFPDVVAASSTIRDLPSADAIFIGFKRHECNAAVAPTGLLKPVLAALGRDNVAIDVHPGNIAGARLAGWKDLAAADAAAAKEAAARNAAETLRQQAERIADEEQQRALAAEHRRNDEASRREQLAAARAAVTVKSTGLVDQFAQTLRRHMDSVRSESAEAAQRAQTGQVLSAQEQYANHTKYATDRVDSFPPWSDAFTDRTKEGWTFADIKPSVEDFGQSQWRNRTIDAIAIRVEFPMLNRVIGERQTLCYDFVFIDDEEFSFMRQPLAVPCDQYAPAFAEWSQANAFVSQWKLLPPKT